jgi:DNA invertase Pin-like site-specific DNA recombinase
MVAARRDYSAIVVPKLSRFGRSMKQLISLFDVFDTDGIPLVFLDMNLDTSTSQGRLLRHILAAFAEYESDVKGDYARNDLHEVTNEGRLVYQELVKPRTPEPPPVGFQRPASS